MRFLSSSSSLKGLCLGFRKPSSTPSSLIPIRTLLDINLFREEKGYDPDTIRKSVSNRFQDPSIVDDIINLDKAWRQCQFEKESLSSKLNKMTKEIGKLKMSGEDATEMIKNTHEITAKKNDKEVEVKEVKRLLDSKLATVGNIVHDSVPISNDEDNNQVIRSWGERRMEENLKDHVELAERCGIVNFEDGAKVAGSRGYYLLDAGVELNYALINFGLSFLRRRNYMRMRTPAFMKSDVMAKCAQLAQFDEELYKVAEYDKYLCATAEQPLCAYNMGKWICPSKLPLRYAGISTSFRKEAGHHGRDTLGLFRTHEFDKVEQFCMTSPNDSESWMMFEEMINNSEDFYKELNIPYRVVSVVSGALNDAAAKKYDLEGWFPASKTYKELVSCSNCTDYQSRALEIRYGHDTKKSDQMKQYVHLLNSTLTATGRTICCILENYQTEDGFEVPPALQPHMDGKTFIPH